MDLQFFDLLSLIHRAMDSKYGWSWIKDQRIENEHQRISDRSLIIDLWLWSLIIDLQFFDLLFLVHRAMDYKYGWSWIKDQRIEDEHQRISDRSLITDLWSWSLIMELQFFDLLSLIKGLWTPNMVDFGSKIKGSRMNIKGSVTDLWSLIFDHDLWLWTFSSLIFYSWSKSYGLQIWLILDQRSKDRGWTSKDQWQIFDHWSLIMISDHGPSVLWSPNIVDHESKIKGLRMKDQMIGSNPGSLILDPMIFVLLILWSLILDHMIIKLMSLDPMIFWLLILWSSMLWSIIWYLISNPWIFDSRSFDLCIINPLILDPIISGSLILWSLKFRSLILSSLIFDRTKFRLLIFCYLIVWSLIFDPQSYDFLISHLLMFEPLIFHPSSNDLWIINILILDPWSSHLEQRMGHFDLEMILWSLSWSSFIDES